MEKTNCSICKKEIEKTALTSLSSIRPELVRLIKIDHPDCNENSMICHADLKEYRVKYLAQLVKGEKGHLKKLEKEVLKSIAENEIITENVNNSANEKLVFGDKIADKVAEFGGSWKFIISFFSVLVVWITVNAISLFQKPFDPYPFILLNLLLSCLAAVQAPIIMMSQNRLEAKDRLRSENDYKVNLKSEIEIRTLHEKVDHLLQDQWTKIVKIQEMQIELLEDIREKLEHVNPKAL